MSLKTTEGFALGKFTIKAPAFPVCILVDHLRSLIQISGASELKPSAEKVEDGIARPIGNIEDGQLVLGQVLYARTCNITTRGRPEKATWHI